MTNRKLDELMAGVVERLVEAVESAGEWEKPWRSLATGTHHQVESRRPYQGINAVILWVEEIRRGLADPRWGTYKTWQRVGGQVKTGEKGTRLIFWKNLYRCDDCEAEFGDDADDARAHRGERGHEVVNHPVLRWFTVFNAEQVEGVEPYEREPVPTVEIQMARARDFVESTGVLIVDHPNRAFFNHAQPDRIHIPAPGQFNTEAAYWGTVTHELTHWTGHESRLSRGQRSIRQFGDEAYASEELVAELGSAFLSAHLGIELEPHPEHAAYLANWLRAIKAEPSRLYHASRYATEAVRFLVDLADEGEVAA